MVDITENLSDAILRCVCREALDAVELFLDSTIAGESILLVVGEDGRDVVRMNVRHREFDRISCLERDEFNLSTTWNGASPLVIVEDVDVLTEENDSQWITLLTAKLDTKTSGQKVIGIAGDLEQIPLRMLRAGRFDQKVDLTTAPNIERREEVFRLLGVKSPESYSIRTPGYTSRDFRKLIREVGLPELRKAEEPEQSIPVPKSLGSADSPLARWSDIAGYDQQKSMLKKLLEWPVTYEATFKALGAEAPRGLLLHGPSGCGKTLIASAVAGELSSSNFIIIKPTDLFSKYLGETEAAIRKVFARARRILPCIICIDEIDSICRRRNAEEDQNLDRRVLGSILTELDGLNASGRAFLLGCTNRLDLIDPALLRPGRIDQLLEIPLPSEADRHAILCHYTRRFGLEDEHVRLTVRCTAGVSPATLQSIARQAGLNAIRCENQSVTTVNLNDALKDHHLPAIAVQHWQQ